MAGIRGEVLRGLGRQAAQEDGLSPQRPLYRAYQQDPEQVAEWKKSIHPKIRKLAAEEGASIFCEDEASVRTDHHARTTWALVGQTLVVMTTGEAPPTGHTGGRSNVQRGDADQLAAAADEVEAGRGASTPSQRSW
jgi:hypothetical protein